MIGRNFVYIDQVNRDSLRNRQGRRVDHQPRVAINSPILPRHSVCACWVLGRRTDRWFNKWIDLHPCRSSIRHGCHACGARRQPATSSTVRPYSSGLVFLYMADCFTNLSDCHARMARFRMVVSSRCWPVRSDMLCVLLDIHSAVLDGDD